MKIFFSKLDKNAIIPTKSHFDDAGWDFYALESKYILPHSDGGTIKTGIRWYVEKEAGDKLIPYLQLKSRSGLGIKMGIEVSNAGVVDCGYSGEIIVKLYNKREVCYRVRKGERVAQGIIHTIPNIEVLELKKEQIPINKENDNFRGKKGFGSSGR